MSNVLDRLKKKRGYPITIDGETYHARSLTLGELRRLEAIPHDQKTGFVVGCALCQDVDGQPEFPRNPDETDLDWATRIMGEVDDIPTETLRSISQGVADIGRTPKVEGTLKN